MFWRGEAVTITGEAGNAPEEGTRSVSDSTQLLRRHHRLGSAGSRRPLSTALVVALVVSLAGGWLIPARGRPSARASRSFDAAITKAHATLADAEAQGAADAGLLSLQRERLEAARGLVKLLGQRHKEPLAKAVRLALAATKAQATSLGLTLPDAPPVARHGSPSEALQALLATHGATAGPDDVAAMSALDDLPAAVGVALTDVIDNFVAFQSATTEAVSAMLGSQGEAEAAAPAAAVPELGRLFAARTSFLLASQRLGQATAANQSAAEDVPPLQLPQGGDDSLGLISIDLSESDNTYRRDFVLAIDGGGDDTYHNNAGGRHKPSGTATPCLNVREAALSADPNRVAAMVTTDALVDYGAGEDAYGDPGNPRTCGANGGGNSGAGFLLDGGGDDTYTSSGYNAGTEKAPGGAGGNNGGGYIGAGFLVDEGGLDHYDAGSSGANGGGFGGQFTAAGLLVDAGNERDEYRAGSRGVNGGGGHGSGLLLDAGGDDLYRAGHGGVNGGATEAGTGIVIDRSGHDTYTSVSDDVVCRLCSGSNGGAGLGSAGLLVDFEGSDLYRAPGGAVNGGTAGGSGILLDGDGDDDYYAQDFAVNGGATTGVGALFDVRGNDCYTATGIRATNGGGGNGPAGFESATAQLTDGDGYDVYRDSRGVASNQTEAPKGIVGGQFDIGTPPAATDPCAVTGAPPTTSTTSTSSTSSTSTSTTSTTTTSTTTTSSTLPPVVLPSGAETCSKARSTVAPVADMAAPTTTATTTTTTVSSTTATTASPLPPNDRAPWVHEPKGAHPPARVYGAMAPDRTGEVVLFGGARPVQTFVVGVGTAAAMDDTWKWGGTSWTKVCPAVSPSARYGAAMAYHPASGKAVLFGGTSQQSGVAQKVGDLGDTWLWDGSSWTRALASPGATPDPRTDAVMAEDRNGNLVLFGGYNVTREPPLRTISKTIFNDTWIWNGSVWREGDPSSVPPLIDPEYYGAPGLAYHPPSSQTIMVKSHPEGVSSETWAWNGTDWARMDLGAQPPARKHPEMAYHPGLGRVVLFGGHGQDDTWTFDGSQWTRHDPAQHPPTESDLAAGLNGMAYHGATGRVLVLAPSTGLANFRTNRASVVLPVSHGLGDTWTWDGRTESQLPQLPSDPPDLRETLTLALDPPSIPADGKSMSVAKVRYAIGKQPIGGREIHFDRINGEVSFEPPTCQTDGSGECNVTVRADLVPGKNKIMAYVANDYGSAVTAVLEEVEAPCSDRVMPPQGPPGWWGNLDLGFDCHGTNIKKVHDETLHDVHAEDVAVQRNKGIIVLTDGRKSSGSYPVSYLARYLPNGTPDGAFGSSGYAKVRGYGIRMVIQPHDGKLVVLSLPSSRFLPRLLSRFNSDGSPDNGIPGQDSDPSDRFGQDGTASAGEEASGWDLVLQRDHKIVVAGNSLDGTSIVLTRVTESGEPDAQFGGNAAGRVTLAYGDGNSMAWAVDVQPDRDNPELDNIVVAGTWRGLRGTMDVVSRLRHDDGSLDTTFNACPAVPLCGGHVAKRAQAFIADMLVQREGIVTLDNAFNLSRYLPEGRPDGSFMTCGSKRQPPCTSGDASTAASTAADHGAFRTTRRIELSRKMDLQPDGKIVVAGVSNRTSEDSFEREQGQPGTIQPTSYLMVKRYNGDGSPDDDCGTPSSVRTHIGYSSEALAIAVQPHDGKIVAAGYSQNGDRFPTQEAEDPMDGWIALARYEGGPGPSLTNKVSVDDIAVKEPAAGALTKEFTLSLEGPACRAITVAYETVAGTATAGKDFEATKGSVTFAPGQVTRPVKVEIKGDTLPEDSEKFTLELSNPRVDTDLERPLGPSPVTLKDSTGVATIADERVVSISDSRVTEPTSGTTPARFTVSLSGATDKDVTVSYATADDTATAPDDYASTRGTATIPAGEKTATVTVPVVGDGIAEGSETFFLRLTTASGATIVDDEGVATIADASVAPGPAPTIPPEVEPVVDDVRPGQLTPPVVPVAGARGGVAFPVTPPIPAPATPSPAPAAQAQIQAQAQAQAQQQAQQQQQMQAQAQLQAQMQAQAQAAMMTERQRSVQVEHEMAAPDHLASARRPGPATALAWAAVPLGFAMAHRRRRSTTSAPSPAWARTPAERRRRPPSPRA